MARAPSPTVLLAAASLLWLPTYSARPWNLPSAKARLPLDQTLTAALKGYRGGGGYNGDDWNSPPGDPYTNNNSNQEDDYYSQQANNDRYTDDYNDDDRYDAAPSRRRSKSGGGVSNLIKYGDKRIGLMLVTSGIGVMVVGFSLFLNKTLMRLGNLLFISGVPMFIGPSRAFGFFANPRKIRASGSLALGIFLVFIGWPIFGILLELFGLLNLFGNMFPMVWMILKQMPVIGPMLKQSKKSKGSRRRSDDDYYDDYGNSKSGSYDDQANDYYQDSSYRDDYPDDRDGNGGYY